MTHMTPLFLSLGIEKVNAFAGLLVQRVGCRVVPFKNSPNNPLNA